RNDSFVAAPRLAQIHFVQTLKEVPQDPALHRQHQAQSALTTSETALKVSPENLLALRTRTNS
ncbi:MAG: hypothetical protein ACK5A3_11190, partial [Planctomyces sp.]